MKYPLYQDKASGEIVTPRASDEVANEPDAIRFTLAKLKALDKSESPHTDIVHLLGREEAGDGAAGLFWWDGESKATINNNGGYSTGNSITMTVDAIPEFLKAGTVLEFTGGGKFTLTSDAAEGATSITGDLTGSDVADNEESSLEGNDAFVVTPTYSGFTGPGRWRRIHDEGWYNARWWGMKPDDNTFDNQPLLSGAFEDVFDEEEIYFPVGKYYFDSPVELTRPITLRGQHRENSQLLFQGVHGFYTTSRTDPIQMYDLRIEDVDTALNTIGFHSTDYTSYIQMDMVRFVGFGQWGLKQEGGLNCQYTNMLFSGNGENTDKSDYGGMYLGNGASSPPTTCRLESIYFTSGAGQGLRLNRAKTMRLNMIIIEFQDVPFYFYDSTGIAEEIYCEANSGQSVYRDSKMILMGGRGLDIDYQYSGQAFENRHNVRITEDWVEFHEFFLMNTQGQRKNAYETYDIGGNAPAATVQNKSQILGSYFRQNLLDIDSWTAGNITPTYNQLLRGLEVGQVSGGGAREMQQDISSLPAGTYSFMAHSDDLLDSDPDSVGFDTCRILDSGGSVIADAEGDNGYFFGEFTIESDQDVTFELRENLAAGVSMHCIVRGAALIPQGKDHTFGDTTALRALSMAAEMFDEADVSMRRFTSPAGATADRPSSPFTGEPFFDTDLGKPIWWDGPNWVDATGSTV